MSNNYHDTTGVLLLEKVTPVIEALFKPYRVDGSHPGNGEAYIASIAECTNTSWDQVIDCLEAYATSIDLEIPEDGVHTHQEEVLFALATHFGLDSDDRMANLIEETDFEQLAGIGDLCLLAEMFNDGHGLRGFKAESSWHCSKPELFQFGGAGEYCGKHVSVEVWSGQALELGHSLETALDTSDFDKAAEILAQKFEGLASGILDHTTRAVVRAKVLALLAKDAQ